MRLLHLSVALSLLFSTSLEALSQSAQEQANTGIVLLNNLSIPQSSLLSPEAHAYMVHLLRDRPFAGGPSAKQDIVGYRAKQDEIMNVFLGPIRARYAVTVEHKKIGGIDADIVTPSGGVSPQNRDRVLLNVHGGGFTSGAHTASLVESIPIASIEKIKVITIDYRMWPEAKFPAASEDVAAVYREILKSYKPQRIGLYGCSSGGMLSAMSIAWFQKEHLPRPGAVGVLCASLGDMFAGDSGRLAGALNGMTSQPPPQPQSETKNSNPFPYLSGTDPANPLMYPIASPEAMSKFPPTLLITSTRAFEFSSALDSANALTRAGVETQLRVWDGLPHAFWYNSDLPESREVYAVIANFFDRHLAH